ncbi:PilN domain-containing protein [Candidatus Beckwithbacteria bacterium]|nr:PilN domain-containing protein [Candidatus Beckwithbacteria bacterium]
MFNSDKKNSSINFLNNKKLDNTKIGKVINWATTIGKSIICLTFSFVIFSFIYRFYLDHQIELLTEKIQNNINEIDQYSQHEKNIIDFQSKLNLVEEKTKDEIVYIKVFRALEICMPKQSQLKNIEMNKKSLKIEGTTQNEVIFSNFLNALKKQEIFSQIIIDDLKTEGVLNPKISFVIKLQIV